MWLDTDLHVDGCCVDVIIIMSLVLLFVII